MQEIKDLVSTMTETIRALQSRITQAGYTVTMPEKKQTQQVGWSDTAERTVPIEPPPVVLRDMVPAFADALKAAGFATAGHDNLDTTPEIYREPDIYETKGPEHPLVEALKSVSVKTEEPTAEVMEAEITQVSETSTTLMKLLSLHKADRDGFCKAAKGAVPTMKTNEIRQWYGTQRKLGMANGTWPKPLTPTQRKKLDREPRPTVEQIVEARTEAAVVEPQPEVVAGPEKINGYTAPEVAVAQVLVPTFNEQVQAMRKAELDKAMNPTLAKIEGQVAQDAAGNKHNSLLQLARTTARALGANGPISVDEVTAAMSATSNVLPVAGKQLNMWKGKIFNKSEWIYVGTKATSMVSSHARHVGVWALKTWLKDHTLNGTAASVSNYNLFGIYKDQSRLNTTRIKVEAEKFTWFIGDENLSPELRATITKDNNTMYGIPVSFIPGAVGAMLLPPDPSKGLARVETK